jgi:hypothetical protein
MSDHMHDVDVSIEQLSDKADPKIKALLKTSFEYLLAGVAQKNAEYNHYRSVERFNLYNSMMKTAVVSYPFFIALSNGHSESLYSLFGKFYAYPLGPVSKSIIDLLKDDQNNKLDFFEVNSMNICVKNDAKDFEELKNQIKAFTIEGFEADPVSFERIKIQKNDGHVYGTRLCDALDKGINIVANDARYLFDGSMDSVKGLALYYGNWVESYQGNRVEILEYANIGTTRQNRPIYSVV